jgi:methanogenic corrinoid protein MtbC1
MVERKTGWKIVELGMNNLNKNFITLISKANG